MVTVEDESLVRPVMQYQALIVEQDEKVLEEVVEVVESLDHRHIECSNQADAIAYLRGEENQPSYIVSGLLIPVKPRSRRCLPDTCRHFLHQSRKITQRPFIVTAPWQYAAKGYGPAMVRSGAFDLIDLPAPSRGRSLSESIRHALRESRPLEPPDSKNPPEAFTEGTLTFYNDRIELNGVALFETGELGHAEQFLRLLTMPNDHGRRPKLGGYRLSKLLNGASQDAISSMVLRLRRKISAKLGRELNVRVGKFNVVATNEGGGYYVPATITVEDKTNDTEPARPKVCELIDPSCNTRQHRIIEALCTGETLTRHAVEQLCRVSERTAKRDLGILRDKGLVEFVGYGQRGCWRLKDKAICQTIPSE
jgi:hypothetical protein